MSALPDPVSRSYPALAARLRNSLGNAKAEDIERAATRLYASLRSTGLANAVVLAMYGGGKDSSFMLAAARYMQLCLRRLHGESFLLRVASNRHAGMPSAVLRNIDRVYRALGLYGDPDAELLLIDGDSVSFFDPNRPLPQAVRHQNRLDILMSGHRCQGDPRPTFCNRCNLSMENGLALAIGYGRHATVVLTGDSPSEQKKYQAWARHASRKLGCQPGEGAPGLRTFLHDLDQIGGRLAEDIFGPASSDSAAHRVAVDAVHADPLFFSIYEDTTYRAGDHWQLITGFLGFRFDEIAFSFTESDCANPGVMAHLNGLRHERLLGSDYAAGIREYENFAVGLMRKKEFPEHLIATVRKRYATPSGIARMRRLMDGYAREAFDLSEQQLVCMIFSPFAGEGRHLREYLTSEHPRLARCEGQIRRLLSGEIDPREARGLDEVLTRISGLDSDHRRILFRAPLVPTRQPGAASDNPISIILSRDPHKAVIERRTADGQIVRELISGR